MQCQNLAGFLIIVRSKKQNNPLF